jgi:hypothetical protein
MGIWQGAAAKIDLDQVAGAWGRADFLDRLRGVEFGDGMTRARVTARASPAYRSSSTAEAVRQSQALHTRTAMRHAQASQTFDRQDKGTQWRVGVTGLAGALILAGVMLALSSVQGDARPSYVTASKPCGSCHPPNKPPKKK